jgi:hypothetical protein
LCQRVSENTLFPPIDSRPGKVGLIFWLNDLKWLLKNLFSCDESVL